MYCITDQQIEFVLNDIRRNGIETEDLQLNLLDHICCLAEHTLKDGDDFEGFYHTAITQFYKKELREIEEETIQLLTFKNYYMMKKIMMVGGTLSVLAFLAGSVLKVFHLPGGAILLTLGILSISFFFLPFMFILKAKEVNSGMEKLIIALGTLLGILFCLNILFTFNHWPAATMLWYTTICLSIFVFIPLYFFTGIRRAETRTNTLITSIMLIGFTGLLFTIINLRASTQLQDSSLNSYLQNEEIWNNMEVLYTAKPDAHTNELAKVLALSEEMKVTILKATTMDASLRSEQSQLYFRQEPLRFAGTYFKNNGEGLKIFQALRTAVEQYNATIKSGVMPIPTHHSFLAEPATAIGNLENLYILNSLTQLQIFAATTALANANKTVALR